MTVIPFIPAFTHKTTREKKKGERERSAYTFQNAEQKQSWMLADKDVYLWFNSCSFDFAMTVPAIGPLNWFRILSIDWIFLIHLNEKKARRRRNFIPEQKKYRSDSFIRTLVFLFACMCVCVREHLSPRSHTNIAISLGCLPLLQCFINTRHQPYRNHMATATAKCVSFRAKRMQKAIRAKQTNTLNCALMQPIFGYCILLMPWIVHEFSHSFSCILPSQKKWSIEECEMASIHWQCIPHRIRSI